MLIIAEIGDVKRFPTAKHLCQWAGLTPTVRSSDGKARLGHISPPRLHDPALGAVRGRAAHPHRRRAAQGAIRADRQTPRPQDRQSRHRAPDPHPLLLRTQGRRDPLPHPPAHRHRHRAGQGRMTPASPPQACAHHQGARCKPGRARSCVWPPPSRQDGRRS
jgi:hypothetical protein